MELHLLYSLQPPRPLEDKNIKAEQLAEAMRTCSNRPALHKEHPAAQHHLCALWEERVGQNFTFLTLNRTTITGLTYRDKKAKFQTKPALLTF